MIKILTLRSVAAMICVTGLIAGCQTNPNGYTQPRIEAVNPNQNTPHYFWKNNNHRPMMQWRNTEYKQLLPTACADKIAGQAVTITLQSGKVIQGSCILQFKPYPPLNSR